MKAKRVDVLVVGAGPAGMVAACLLARAGLKTLVVERNEDFHREFRGEILQPRFHKAMRDVGLFDHIEGYPHEEVEGAHVYANGRRIGEIPLTGLDPRSGTTWWMTQPDLLQALHDYGRGLAGFELWFQAPLKKLAGRSARVGRGREEREIEARVVIGADGRFSTARKLGGFALAYDRHDVDVVWFALPRPRDYKHIFSFFLNARHNYLILPKYPDLLQCGLIVGPDEFPRMRGDGLEPLREELRAAHPVFADFAAGLRNFSPFHPLKGNSACVVDWVKDGVVLIGDAAHTCSPVGGIGVAIAIETACVAAGVVAEGFAQGDLSDDRLRTIQRLRQAEVHEVHRLQGRVRLVVSGPGFVRRLAPWTVAALGRLGVLPVLARRLLTQRRPLPLRAPVT